MSALSRSQAPPLRQERSSAPATEAPIVRLQPQPLAPLPAAAPAERHPTGVARLDHLLGGGLPAGGALLVVGPSFLGKRVLARRVCLANMAQGLPSLTVTCDLPAQDARRHLAAMGPGFAAAQQAGLDHMVDGSGLVGPDEALPPRTAAIGDAADVGQLAAAVRQRHAAIGGPHVAVLDSLSSLIACAGAGAAFRFARALVGQTRRLGGTTVLVADAHVHALAELEQFKHLASGVVEVQADRGRPSLRVRGLGVPVALDWIEYSFSASSFELTGSFASSRIR